MATVLLVFIACTDPAEPDPAEPNPPGPPPATVTFKPLPGGEGQSALRGTALSQPLRVKVEVDGQAKPGARIAWKPSSGSVSIISSLTDQAGVATAVWTLGGAPGPMTLTATAVGLGASPVTFGATALPLITVVPDPSTDRQAGVVGSVLGQPLRARVYSEGVPSPGVQVSWSYAHVPFLTGMTDAAGVATATITLLTSADHHTVFVTTPGLTGPPAVLSYTALAGPAAVLIRGTGDGIAGPANYPSLGELRVSVYDLYENTADPAAVRWAVVSGPVEIQGGSALSAGSTLVRVNPAGTPGEGVIRAELDGGLSPVDFHVTVGEPVWLVLLDPVQEGFVSAKNGTRPAVDTIPVGKVMHWIVSPFDYETHGVIPVGTPAFAGGGDIPYAAQLSVTFTTSGTYQYVDPYFGLTGTVVVQ